MITLISENYNPFFSSGTGNKTLGPPPSKEGVTVPKERGDIDASEDRVRPTFGLTVGRISQDIREDFQIPLIERVLDVLVTVKDTQVVRQSVDKLLKYLTDENKIPP